MRFTVIWTSKAEGQLFDLWSDFPDQRTELTEIADEIDRVLRNDPQTKGRPLGACRILIKAPLVVLYQVDEGDRKVNVLSVKKF
jgi:mRNA-degrading endonuclease RelE of RelBE toxin-antitoxin system